MTRGAQDKPPRARPSCAARAGTTAVAASRLAVGLAVAAIALGSGPGLPRADGADGSGSSPDGKIIRELRVVGNDTIAPEVIRSKIKSRVDRPYDSRQVDQDVRKLSSDEKLFSDVTTSVAPAPEGDGVILTFQLVEMPVLRNVEFRGRTKIKQKEIEKTTGLKKGARADHVIANLARNQIRQLYEDQGYEKAEVKLIKGGSPADREVIFEIYEGPWSHVGAVNFVGNRFVSDAVLATKVASRRPILDLLGGHYTREGFDDDAEKLADYYQANGYLMVQVRPVVRSGADIGTRDVTFVIHEGPRFRVRKVLFEGNQVIPADQLGQGLKLHSGGFYNDAVQKADINAIKGKYTVRGHIDARVDHDTKYTTDPGVIDLVYKVFEGDEYTLGRVITAGNARTQDSVLRREADLAGLLPGERLDSTRIDKFQQRLSNTGFFQGAQAGKPPTVKVVNRRPFTRPFGDDSVPLDLSGLGVSRMQDPDDPPADGPPRMEPPPPSTTPGGGTAPGLPFGSGGVFRPEVDTLPEPLPRPDPAPAPAPGRPGLFGRRPFFDRGPAGDTQPRQSDGPAGSINDPSNPSGASPGFPNNNINPQIGPDRQEPFTANKAYADILANVDEAPTAKFSVGFGASSFGGLYGNVTFVENNFNILAVPRSLNDIYQGRAFRGAGQQFSVELSPGTLINYYSVSFRNPSIFNLPVGFQTSGYQFSRYYTDWHEQRSGGRFALGGQVSPQSYLEAAFRIEDVGINGFRYPAPAALLDVAGHTTLATIRPSFKIDTRDSPFLASAGGFYELAFEEGLATYTYSKFTAEARKYFTVGQRPDGSGKRVLTLRGFFGVTGRDTPIYERFFAGNLNSLRGFAFRGIGPHVLTVNTGGIITALASVEYRFPWTANDHVQQVVFMDTGTVEEDYRFTTYRVSVGTGVRLIIPQIFKQVPLALDLAFPLNKAPGDRTQAFNFSIGAVY